MVGSASKTKKSKYEVRRATKGVIIIRKSVRTDITMAKDLIKGRTLSEREKSTKHDEWDQDILIDIPCF
jgi:hypothetical protein